MKSKYLFIASSIGHETIFCLLIYGRHSYVSGEWRVESGERRGSKNSKIPKPNLDFKKRSKYTQNIVVFSKIIKNLDLFSWNV